MGAVGSSGLEAAMQTSCRPPKRNVWDKQCIVRARKPWGIPCNGTPQGNARKARVGTQHGRLTMLSRDNGTSLKDCVVWLHLHNILEKAKL